MHYDAYFMLIERICVTIARPNCMPISTSHRKIPTILLRMQRVPQLRRPERIEALWRCAPATVAST